MAGKLSNFNYESDDGKTYLIRLDRTNGQAITLGYGLPCCNVVTTNILLPWNITPRYVLCINRDNPKQKRKFIFGNKNIWKWSWVNKSPGVLCEDYPGQDQTKGINRAWLIRSRHAEKILYIPQI